MGFEIFKDIFKRNNKGRTDYPAHIVCPNDPGIILSSDFGAAAMIREDGIRLVHITGQYCEAIPLLKNIERPEFFYELPNFVRRKVADKIDPKSNVLTYEEKIAFDAVLHRNDDVTTRLKAATLPLKSHYPELRTACQGRRNANAPEAALRWHVDQENGASDCIGGTGTKYAEGILTVGDVASILRTQILPAHVRVRETGPGDILIVRGWWEAHQREFSRVSAKPRKSIEQCLPTAQLHQAGSFADYRTVMLHVIS